MDFVTENAVPHSIQWETNHHFFQRTLFFGVFQRSIIAINYIPSI
jgi:hypothetical protein